MRRVVSKMINKAYPNRIESRQNKLAWNQLDWRMRSYAMSMILRPLQDQPR